ncbi:Uncharacterized protein BM_BM9436 [Brugia malayi]|uniref:Uncharacterized protein n=2 Tax=Brugia TaxID=6278 RepID=A0A4E9FAJ9_BRUMA|nr:Uncharacterized protein BM_BM9436 [Brugia malayi]VDO35076.1 unnamed protein product [Brugia timori]VIO93402.1 Uncharacterized protein BM_BM9436 [Brugia malayi]
MDQSNEECAATELRRFASLLRELRVTDSWHTKSRRKFIQIQVCEYLKFYNV